MTSFYFLTAFSLAVAMAAPAFAQDTDHSAHEPHGQAAMHDHAEMMQQGAASTLEAYRAALVARDAGAMSALFATNSHVFENGKDEGSFADYLAHHIGPELDAIEIFTFTDPTLEVEVDGHMAFGRETYSYFIRLKDGREITRDGVATSVLRHDAEGWKIVSHHSSSRASRQ